MLRRRVEEVAKDLPEKIEIPQPLIMDKKASEEYEEIRRQTKDEYGNNATLRGINSNANVLFAPISS